MLIFLENYEIDIKEGWYVYFKNSDGKDICSNWDELDAETRYKLKTFQKGTEGRIGELNSILLKK